MNILLQPLSIDLPPPASFIYFFISYPITY